MTEHDLFQRFFFEDLGIRGEFVRLRDAWTGVRSDTDYPPLIASILGEALAATVLLTGTLKFEGSLILQIQGNGPVSTLVAQATHTLTVRGLAHWRTEPKSASLMDLFGDGRMVLTIQQFQQEPYQGIVALEGDSLATAIESYFSRSEQLPTRIWLFADGNTAAGLFIQALPGKARSHEDWSRISHLADTLTRQEAFNLPSEELLYRLFHEERVRVLEPEPVVFRCGCSRERIESMLIAMGRDEAEASLDEHNEILVACEFCNRRYRFDRIDITRLFHPTVKVEQPSRLH